MNNFEEAMSGLDGMFEPVQECLKGFKKKTYPEVFKNLMSKYERTFACVEELYRAEEDKEHCLNRLAERLVDLAQTRIENEKRKTRRETMKIDYNMFAVSYLFPAILEYRGQMSGPFAEKVKEQWNSIFGTQLECAGYECICGGFRNTIFGIDLDSFGRK
ncbi:MAG: hypothetical protein ACI4DV_00585 [Lachnospiraceae bacterium]